MVKLKNIEQIDKRVNEIFKTNYDDETIFILADIKYAEAFTRTRTVDNKILSKVTIEKNVEINGIDFEVAAIISFDSLNEEEILFLDNIFISIFLNREYLSKDIGELFEIATSLISSIRLKKIEEKFKEIGLIGEILSLIKLKDYIEDISKYVLGSSTARFDISLSEESKIEVKSTTKTKRVHNFGIEQLRGRENIIISSVKLEKDDNGLTLKKLITENFDLIMSVPLEKRAEIMQYSEIIEAKEDKCKFNLEKSLKNILFYKADRIIEKHLKDGKNDKFVTKISVELQEEDSIEIEKIIT